MQPTKGLRSLPLSAPSAPDAARRNAAPAATEAVVLTAAAVHRVENIAFDATEALLPVSLSWKWTEEQREEIQGLADKAIEQGEAWLALVLDLARKLEAFRRARFPQSESPGLASDEEDEY